MARRVVLLAAGAVAFAPTAPLAQPRLRLSATATDVETDKEERLCLLHRPRPRFINEGSLQDGGRRDGANQGNSGLAPEGLEEGAHWGRGWRGRGSDPQILSY